MTDELLQSAWQKMKAPLQTENILDVTMSEMDALKKKIRRRNRREIGAAIFLIIFFLPFVFYASDIYAKIGAFLIALSATMIMVMLQNKKNVPAADITLPPVPYLYQHLNYLKKEAKILNTVMYWYILPLVISVGFLFAGTYKDLLQLAFRYAAMLFLALIVYVINNLAVKTIFQPLIAKLEAMLKEEAELTAATDLQNNTL